MLWETNTSIVGTGQGQHLALWCCKERIHGLFPWLSVWHTDGYLGGSGGLETVMSSWVCVKKLKVGMALTLSPNESLLVFSKVTKLSLSAAAERVQFNAHTIRLPCDRKADTDGVLQAAETAPDSCGEEKIFWCQHETTNANSGVSTASLGAMGSESPSIPKPLEDLSSEVGQRPIPALQEGCASCHLSFYHCRKEIQSLKQQHQEVSLMLSKIRSLRNAIHDDRNCKELKCLLQTKDQYDCLIRDRKALVSELDNEVRTSEPLSGSAWYSRAETCDWQLLEVLQSRPLMGGL